MSDANRLLVLLCIINQTIMNTREESVVSKKYKHGHDHAIKK